MTKRATGFDLALAADLKPGNQRQGLYTALRAAILGGRLRAGARLPSSRELSGLYGLTRTTVVAVYEQLSAEGYVVSRVGSGTRVSHEIPDACLERRARGERRVTGETLLPVLSARGGRLAAGNAFGYRRPARLPVPFQAHVPALEAFPRDLWTRLAARSARSEPLTSLGAGDVLGWPPLRAAIAEYLNTARGVHCSAEQIFITSGAQQSLGLAARLLLDPDDPVWMEDPGYSGAAQLLVAEGVTTVPVPVDSQGIVVAEGEKRAPQARMAFVTPAHQAPTGVAMSLTRRVELLEWATRNRAWIFEDDYDSEYRYSGTPLPALHSLDRSGLVIHAGSFSKTLFPALRLGYLVVPSALIDAFAAARSLLDRYPPINTQVTLHAFITEGHYARHLRRMRTLYAERRQALARTLALNSDGKIEIGDHEAGLEAVAWLPARVDDLAIARQAREHGLAVEAVNEFSVEPHRPGLLLGFAAYTPRRLRAAAVNLVAIIKEG